MIGALAFLGYVAVIWAANWAIHEYGMVSVGFGFLAPAGVYFAGLAFGLRDVMQEKLGNWATVVAIAIGALLSLAVADLFVAAASCVAFLLSDSRRSSPRSSVKPSRTPSPRRWCRSP